MQTTLKELPDSRVEVEAEVPAEDVQRAANRTARAMAREMRLPGFRKGKAPPDLVIQRMGFGAVLAEAVRDALPEWYEAALLDAGVTPIGDPDIDIGHDPRGRGRAARPSSSRSACGRWRELGEYKGLEVGKEDKEVDEEVIDTEVDRVREGFARLEPVERASKEGDAVLIDFEGFVDDAAVPGRQGRRLPAGARLGPADRQLRGAADRRRARRRGRGRGHLPRRLPGRETGRQRRGLQSQGQGGAGEDPARARRRLRLRRLRVRHAGGAARRHPRESRRAR